MGPIYGGGATFVGIVLLRPGGTTLQTCDTEDDVVDEVAVTVVHEIAHHFGIDDQRLHALGWG